MKYHLRARRGFVVTLLVVMISVTLLAQATSRREDSERPRWEINPYVGLARHSPVGTRLGVIPDRNHLFLGVHTVLNLLGSDRWAFGYAPEVVPLLLVSNNPKYRTFSASNGRKFMFENGRGLVAGFAISPIGFEGKVRVAPHWQAYGAGAMGGVWFTREVPVAYSRTFNYTFEFGGGVRWAYRPHVSLRVGYKFHHLSNAYTARANPGLDANVFLFGFDRAIGSR